MELLLEGEREHIEFTILRPPELLDEKLEPSSVDTIAIENAQYVRWEQLCAARDQAQLPPRTFDGVPMMRRSDVAAYMLHCAHKRLWVKQFVAIC